tara:strand:+ start:812 stop:1009 length:198 start_codon:yes stop_codon:yes gene_type:complete
MNEEENKEPRSRFGHWFVSLIDRITELTRTNGAKNDRTNGGGKSSTPNGYDDDPFGDDNINRSNN